MRPAANCGPASFPPPAIGKTEPVNNDYRFLNQSQPQTLYLATLLCYIDAVFGFFGYLRFIGPLGLITIVGLGAGGFGVANEKKWGYAVAVAAAIMQVLLLVWLAGGALFDISVLISFAFDVVLVALLLHPMSRDYQRIWFH